MPSPAATPQQELQRKLDAELTATDEELYRMLSILHSALVLTVGWASVVVGAGCVVPSGASESAWSWRLPGVIFLWHSMYLMGCGLARKVFADSPDVDGYPMWCYAMSIFHGACVLPILMALVCWEVVYPSSAAQVALIDGPWTDAPVHRYLQHALLAVISALLKDFLVLEQDATFVVHHLACIFGATMCLHIPMGAGLVVFNGCFQAEFASALYNAQCLWPRKAMKVAYLTVMAASNIGALLVGLRVWAYPIALEWRITYVVLDCLLVVLRSVGWALELQALVFVDGEMTKKQKEN